MRPTSTSFVPKQSEGALIGPWNPWLHEPIIGGAVWELAKIITAQATLAEAARQMAILTVGSHFKAAYELYSHVAVAEASGMSKAKIATVASGSRPAELSEIEGCAYDVAHALTHGGVLPEACFSYAIKLFGQHGTNELIYLVGVYCLVAVTLNGFNVPVPERE